MELDKAKHRKSGQHDGFEVADSTRQLGRIIQRKMQQQQESSGPASSFAHGEDSSFDGHANPPQHDRAG